MQGRKTYQEKLFSSFQLSDRVPEDNFCRKVKQTLDLNFVYASTSRYYGREGQESIDPVVFSSSRLKFRSGKMIAMAKALATPLHQSDCLLLSDLCSENDVPKLELPRKGGISKWVRGYPHELSTGAGYILFDSRAQLLLLAAAFTSKVSCPILFIG